MRRLILVSISLLCIWASTAQSVTFGSSTSINIGESASVYLGGDAIFNGELNNSGTIISYSDLNFVDNSLVGSLRFVGIDDQNLIGDTLFIENIQVDKQGNLNIETPQALVSGTLDVQNGVIQSEEIDDLVVTGQSDNTGAGYVEGSLIGLSTGRPITFPMGVNGFPNYITFTAIDPDVVLLVECIEPDPATLLPAEEMVGIAGQVEWRVMAVDDSTDAQVTVDFSGLDFINFSNGEFINANLYEPAIVVFTESDTLFQALTSVTATPQNTASTRTSGRVESTETIRITTNPIRVAVAWLPLVDGPQFFVPNSFSPKGIYAENHLFRPFFSGGDVSSISMAVYNTYNELVYSYAQSGSELDLSLVGWDGRLNSGTDGEEGVYYYSIQLIADAQVFKKSGSVLLLNQ